MPLLKLNSSKINYQYSIGADNFIISEVVNSTCSYESPIVIRDKQTLDIYFGQNYPGRGYHNELLSSGVSLLLQRPISNKERAYSGEFSFDLNKLREEDNKNIKSYLCFSEFPDVGEENTIYKDSYTENEYLYIPGSTASSKFPFILIGCMNIATPINTAIIKKIYAILYIFKEI